MRSSRWIVLGGWAIASLAAAYGMGCGGSSSTDADEIPVDVGSGGSAGTSDGGPSDAGPDAKKEAGACTIPPIDPATLGPGCCNVGAAHCVDDKSVPGNLADQFPTCKTASGAAAGHCMPDIIIKAGSDFVPAKCEVPVFKVPGVCLSKCIPLIGNNPNVNLLQKASCTADGDVCVPCVNPLDNMPTGACELPDPGCPGKPDGGTDGGKDGGGTDAGPLCPYTGPPILDAKQFPPCTPACGGAHCVPTALIPADQASQLSACKNPDGTAGYCAPDSLVESGGNGVPKTCKSVGGAEGRCLSTCLPAVKDQASLLPKDVCADGEKCTPCFNPFDADPKKATGACTLACDKAKDPPLEIKCPYTGPPLVDPSVFPACSPACGGAHCVPSSLIPTDLQSQLVACTGGFCAPDSLLVSGGKSIPATCKSVAGVEGRCLSECLPAVSGQKDLLPQSTCSAGERCAPCFNPFDADPTKPTGACSLGCDKAKDPPLQVKCPYTGPPVVDVSTFPACSPACGGAHCVPKSLIPDSQAGLLASCNGGQGYCAPDAIVASGGQGLPASCTSVAGVEGRCLSVCLPDVAAQADLLPQATCGAGERCTPCFNPFDADPTKPTGACTLACDKPKDPPLVPACPYTGPDVLDPQKFPACSPACGGAHCVPASLIPADQASQLAPCSGGYCAPDSIIKSGGKSVPKTCTSIAGAEGRCVSTCLPAIADQAALLPQANCEADERCAPCFNPTAADPNAPTGACSLACDKPAQPPLVLTCPYTGPSVIDPAIFPACSPACGGAHCVPASLISDPSQASQLAACTSTNGAPGYCAPDFIVASGGFAVPTTCTSFAGTSAEGRCISACLPSIAAQKSQLSQATCGANELCAPCFDPFTGVDTGACKLSCDMPQKPKFTFPTCCQSNGNARGTCVPSSNIPSSQQSSLQQDICPTNAADYLCVPEEYLPGSTTPIPTCSNILLGAGACVPNCVNLGIGGIFGQGNCPDSHYKCIPCSVAPSGTPGCPLIGYQRSAISRQPSARCRCRWRPFVIPRRPPELHELRLRAARCAPRAGRRPARVWEKLPPICPPRRRT